MSKGTVDGDKKAWEAIYDSYLAKFGLGKDYMWLLDIQEELALAQLDFTISGERFAQNKIRHLEQEIIEFLERPVEGDMDDTIVSIERFLKFRVDEKETTVLKFFKYIKAVNQEIERLKKAS